MKTFKVLIDERVMWSTEVEAKNRKEAVKKAAASTRTALADLKNAGMKCLEAFLADPGSAS